MKRNYLILLTVILMWPIVVTATDFTEVVKAVMPSVFYLTAYDENDKPLRLGTGFLANGLIITNHHVIQHASRVTYKNQFFEGECVDFMTHQTADLAALTPKEGNLTCKSLPTSNNLPQLGEGVFTIGNPSGLDFSVSDGIVSAVRIYSGVQIIQFTAPIAQGSSGGPLINKAGEVVGVVTSMLSESQGLNFANAITELKKLLPTKIAFKKVHLLEKALIRIKELQEQRTKAGGSAEYYQAAIAEVKDMCLIHPELVAAKIYLIELLATDDIGNHGVLDDETAKGKHLNEIIGIFDEIQKITPYEMLAFKKLMTLEMAYGKNALFKSWLNNLVEKGLKEKLEPDWQYFFLKYDKTPESDKTQKLEKLISNHPDYPFFYKMLSNLYSRQKNYEKALTANTLLIHNVLTNKRAVHPVVWEMEGFGNQSGLLNKIAWESILKRQLNCFLKLGRYGEAIKFIEGLQNDEYAKDRDILLCLAFCRWKTGDNYKPTIKEWYEGFEDIENEFVSNIAGTGCNVINGVRLLNLAGLKKEAKKVALTGIDYKGTFEESVLALGGVSAFELGMKHETEKYSERLETIFRCKNMKDDNYARFCKTLIRYFEMVENKPKAEKYNEILLGLKTKDEIQKIPSILEDIP